MSEGYTPPEIYAEAERAMARTAVEKRFSGKNYLFDPELFMEGYDALASEYERANEKQKRDMLMNRYFDGFEPVDDPEVVDSQFEDRFIVRPPELIAYMENGVEEAGIPTLLKDALANSTYKYYGKLWQYGPSRVIDMPAGNYAEIERLGEQDVLGTTAISACTAVVARKDSGSVFMAHVLGSHADTLNAVLEKARERGYRPSDTRLFSPYWIENNGEHVGHWNDRLANLAETNGVNLDWVRYVGYDTHNPDDIRHTTVLVGRDMLRSVGTSFSFRDKRGGQGWYRQKRTVIRPQTIIDYK